jgi:hypothetical protein
MRSRSSHLSLRLGLLPGALPHDRMRPFRRALLLVPFVAGLLSGQTTGRGVIKGTVSSSLGGTLEGAQLRLFFGSIPSARTETDETGSFTFAKVPSGPAWIEVRRLGFRPESLQVTVVDDVAVEQPIQMTRIATELTAVRVLGRRDITGPMAGFYYRQQTGSGRFFTYQEIARRNPSNMTDMLRMVPGIRIEGRGQQNTVRIRGSRCAPLVWLDGQALMAGEVDLDSFDPRTFEGIEIYSGPAAVPVEFQRNQRMSSACGTIVLWSRQAPPREPKRKKGEPTPAGRIALLLEEGKTFLPTDVDQSAKPDSGYLVRPIYPDSMFETATGGRVIAEFVVTAHGTPLMETFNAVSASHRLFVEPVRRAIREQRFLPAVRRGGLVQQVMQLPFEFVPDSTARRRR